MPLIIIEGDDQDELIELVEKALEKVYGLNLSGAPFSLINLYRVK